MTRRLLAAISGVVVILGAGCHYTHIAPVKTTGKMQEWEAFLRESYPDYTPPPTRSIRRNVRKQVSPVQTATLPEAMNYKPMEASNSLPPPVSNDLPQEPVINEVKPEIPANPAVEEVKPEIPADPAEKKVEVQVSEPEAKPEAKPEAPANNGAVATAPETLPDGSIAPPDPTNSSVYEVQKDDSLGSIAKKMYGDARYSSIIFKANSDILKNPDVVRPGMKLIIPTL